MGGVIFNMAITSEESPAPSAERAFAEPQDSGLITLNSSRPVRRALADLWDGLDHWQLWLTLGWEDIRQRYRRSTIGPFWVTLSMAMLIGGIGLMYSGLFGASERGYVPYIAVGFIVWALLTGLIKDGCNSFFSAAGMITQLPAPLSVQVYRLTWKNIIIFGHNLLIYVLICLLYGIYPGVFNLALALLALFIISLNGIWLGLLFGLLSARFRDIPQIVDGVLQIAFFLTPIFWRPDKLPERAFVLNLNPFRYFVDILRQPMLGESIDLKAWSIVILITAVGAAVSFAMFARYRSRISYWV
jgi:ABC-2 type transport system permease protein/lipopolysaccharide transport system permease protein